jgi:hypothetical protein
MKRTKVAELPQVFYQYFWDYRFDQPKAARWLSGVVLTGNISAFAGIAIILWKLQL